VDLKSIEVAHHKKGRVVQALTVLEELFVSIAEAFALALVLPGKVAFSPYVGESTSATDLGYCLFKRIRVARGIDIQQRWLPKYVAQIDEVLL
jgi:hypothetical protein